MSSGIKIKRPAKFVYLRVELFQNNSPAFIYSRNTGVASIGRTFMDKSH